LARDIPDGLYELIDIADNVAMACDVSRDDSLIKFGAKNA